MLIRHVMLLKPFKDVVEDRPGFVYLITLIHSRIFFIHAMKHCPYCQKSVSCKDFWTEVESSRTHFEVLGLGLEGSSPWLWPRSLTSSKIALSLVEDSTIFEQLKFCRKTPETSRKICKYLFYFAQLEHRLSQPGLPPQLKFY